MLTHSTLFFWKDYETQADRYCSTLDSSIVSAAKMPKLNTVRESIESQVGHNAPTNIHFFKQKVYLSYNHFKSHYVILFYAQLQPMLLIGDG